MNKGSFPASRVRRELFALNGLMLFLFLQGVVHAGPLITTDCPISFFTNVANRLLKTQTTLDVSRIQIYPINQYTPAIHRLLQLSANVYDCMTNRPITDYPFVPSVFRPLFTNDSGVIYICGYTEETGTNLLAATMRDLTDAADRTALQSTDMVYGIPAIIGAKKGFPSFNEFAQQMQIRITRKLQFQRSDTNFYSPIAQTNQMYLMSISNTFGLQAWNPYSTAFPRDLQIIVRPNINVIVTNEFGTVLVNSQFDPPSIPRIVASNTWFAYDAGYAQPSLQIPFLTNVTILPNSTYSRTLDAFIPLTNSFEVINPAFWVPHWWLNQKTRLTFAVVDTKANRIVDYVNLSEQKTLSLTDILETGGICNSLYQPDGGRGSVWCTNRLQNPADSTFPTFGILNQFFASLGLVHPDWSSAVSDFPPGDDENAAIDFFRFQFDLSPLVYFNATFYKSNIFNTPFAPFRNIYLTTLWAANDPLVHFTTNDVSDVTYTNVQLDALAPAPVSNIGQLSFRLQSWGVARNTLRNQLGRWDATLKDPSVRLSDSWNFPTNLGADLSKLGQVHRGTPWQTLYLKAGNPALSNWITWTGDGVLVTNSGQFPTTIVPLGVPAFDAYFSEPTNDWRIASVLISLLSTNDPYTLSSPNQTDPSAWLGLLNGLTALTNDAPDYDVHDDPILMQSSSPQAAVMATALTAFRAGLTAPGFLSPGDILAVPELSTNSPWLNLDGIQQQYGISDVDYEAIPSQLLLRLRPDSIGSASQSGGTLRIQFSGADHGRYAVQVSSNLVSWTSVSTNCPANGTFVFNDTSGPGAARRFYRSVLLP